MALHLDRARALLNSGKPEQALPLLEKICKKKPKDAENWILLGITYAKTGALDEAASCFRKATSYQPNAASTHRLLADVLAATYQFTEATTHYQSSLKINSAQPAIYISLGNCLKEDRHIKEAIQAYLRSLELEPQQYIACRKLGELYEELNQTDKARKYAELATRYAPSDVESNFLVARLDVREKQYDQARQRLVELLNWELPPQHRAIILLELGRMLDKIGEYATAFDLVTKGNRLFESSYKAHEHESGLAEYRQEIDHYRHIFTKDLSSAWENDITVESPVKIVFLVGFPRSGTTLTEQILESHPEFNATHELPVLPRLTRDINTIIGRPFSYPDDMVNLTQDETMMLRVAYIQHMENKLDYSTNDSKYLLDKLPLNIINAGLITRLFPEARILVALRDPRDVCLSCFMQTFSLNQAMRQFLDIEDTARFYATVMKLWLHYKETLETNYLETRYEDIVEDLEGSARRILDFVGAPWDRNVLQFYRSASKRAVHTPSYQSVTQPIYRNSVAKWEHYWQELESITPILAPFLWEFAYR